MNIQLGKTEVSLLDPPNEGVVTDDNHIDVWNIGRNGQGMIVLRRTIDRTVHPEFLGGMDMREFCEWINSKL
jgi:hypothetical protein